MPSNDYRNGGKYVKLEEKYVESNIDKTWFNAKVRERKAEKFQFSGLDTLVVSIKIV